MIKVTRLILMFCFLSIMKSTGYSQSILIGVSSGILHFQNPESFTKSISREGLDLNTGVQTGGRITYVFKNKPLKITGLFTITTLRGKGTAHIEAPFWS